MYQTWSRLEPKTPQRAFNMFSTVLTYLIFDCKEEFLSDSGQTNQYI